jgi:hypothetical protein
MLFGITGWDMILNTFNQGVTGSRPVRPTKANKPPLPSAF